MHSAARIPASGRMRKSLMPCEAMLKDGFELPFFVLRRGLDSA